MRRIVLMILAALVLMLTLAACAREAVDKAESAMENVSSKLSSDVSDMFDATASSMTSAPTVRSFETDNPTDGDFGEPNVDDYDDNDADVVGDENEADNLMDSATEKN